MTTPTTTPVRRPAFLLATWAIAAIAQWLLATNPGWFSHDELQWAARAAVDAPSQLPWVAWTDLSPLQWRPLTFNLWLPLSWLLFEHPVAWHALWVGIAAALAASLAALLLRLGSTERVARTAAIAFALGPYAVAVSGWVATLADLLWVGIALALAHALLTMNEQARRGTFNAAAAASTAVVAFGATALALAAKEAALTIPAVLALAWALRHRDRWLAAATVGAAVAAGLYLAMRLPVWLAGDSGGTSLLAPDAVPRHWLAYHVYLLRPSTFEVDGVWNASTVALVLAGALWLALWVAVLRANTRLGLALIVGGFLALAPTLPLAMTAKSFGYAFALWTVACLALAWPQLRFGGRVVVWLFMVVTIWHGANVQREIRRVGERQALFQPALAAALATHRGPLKLYAPDRPWLYRRLTTDISTWEGHEIGDRVRWVESAEDADLVVAENGQLEPP